MTASASTIRDTRWVSTPNGLHARRSCSRHIYFGMVAYKDSLSGIGVESLQRTVKDLAIWFADALGIGNQNGVKHG